MKKIPFSNKDLTVHNPLFRLQKIKNEVPLHDRNRNEAVFLYFSRKALL